MTEPPDQLRPFEPLHTTYVKHRRRHLGNETIVAAGPADPDVEHLVRAVAEEELRKLASQLRSYPGLLAASAVAKRLTDHAERIASWEPTYCLDVWWKDGRREEVEIGPDIAAAQREAVLMLNNDPVTRVEIFYR